MSTEAKTDHSACSFKVSEHVSEDGASAPWIMIETDRPGIPALGNGFLGLTFRPDVSFERAQEIAEQMRDYFEGISYTHFQ